jgi:hypothetical protein
VAIGVWECQSRGYSQAELTANLLEWACGSQGKTAEKEGICRVKSLAEAEKWEKLGIKP